MVDSIVPPSHPALASHPTIALEPAAERSVACAAESSVQQSVEKSHDVYYPAFDLLRIVLAMGVFSSHAVLSGSSWANIGDPCVQVFFALSGFLIGGILLKTHLRDLPKFYFNRSTRIWVPYYIAIAVLVTGALLRQQHVDSWFLKFVFYDFTFVHNLFGTPHLADLRDHMPLGGTGNHFWSICVEEQFYLLAPLIIVFLPRLRALFFVLVYAVSLIFPHDFGAISLGVLLAMSRQRFGEWYLRTPVQVALVALAVFGVVGSVAGLTSYLIMGPWVSVAIVAVLAHRAASKAPALIQLLAGRDGRYRVVKWLGGVSYPFYLNHWTGLFTRKKLEHMFGMSRFSTAVISLSLAFAFSSALYMFVDKRILAKRASWYTPKVGWACFVTGIGIMLLGVSVGLLG